MKKLLILIISLGLFFSACGSDKITGNEKTETKTAVSDQSFETFNAKTVELFETYEAVGTIRPKTEARIDSQIQAQILKINFSAGDRVQKGDVLAMLDDRSLNAKLSQAKANLESAYSSKSQANQEVASAKAGFEHAKSDYNRIKKYYESKAATESQYEKARSAYLQAKAALGRARDAFRSADSAIKAALEQVKEAQVAFNYTKITAPQDGEVLKEMVDEGDLALPGRPLFIIQTSGALMAEVYVREGLVSCLEKGAKAQILVESAEKKLTGVIEEIVPYADPETRTFLIKASIDQTKGLYPGMYAKLLIPVNKRKAVVVPENAVIEVGQLKMADVYENDRFMRVYVKTGAVTEQGLEILSGINENDKVKIN